MQQNFYICEIKMEGNIIVLQ